MKVKYNFPASFYLIHKKLKYFSLIILLYFPAQFNSIQIKMNVQQLPAEKMALLTANEINALNSALCQPPPPSSAYSEEEQDKLYRWSSEFLEGDLETDMLPRIDLLDFALLQDTDHLLQVLLLLPEFTNINLFYYVYIRYTHCSSDYLGSYNVAAQDEYLIGFNRLVDVLIEFGKRDAKVFKQILSWALNGERQLDIHHMRDEHNYFSPQLTVVENLVPEYFTAQEALECYEAFQAYTVSPDYSGGKEYRCERQYPYDKDESVLDYLVYCTTLVQ